MPQKARGGRGGNYNLKIDGLTSMGGIFSSQPPPTEVKTILNTILREMFRRADLIDLYSLADPDRCSKYIVVGADSLKKLFMSINLEPNQTKDGTIYFQKIEGIQKANPMGGEQTQVCKYLAFYFIRIFQVYAALTLSVLDSELPQVDPAPPPPAVKDARGVMIHTPPSLLGFTPPPVKKGWWGGALVQGASPSGDYYLGDRASLYKILNNYLMVPAVGDLTIRFNDYPLAIQINTLYEDIPGAVPPAAMRQSKDFSNPATEKPLIIYTFRDKDAIKMISGRLEITRATNNNINVTIKGANITGKPPQTVTGELIDPILMSSSGKYLPGLIQELFIKAYELIEPPVFSAVDFLKKFNIILSTTPGAKIEQTSITITGAPRGDNIPIRYTGRAKVENSSQEIRIEVPLYITKYDKKVNEQFKYQIWVDLTNPTTKPANLLSSIETKEYKRKDFFTGDADTTTPISSDGQSINAYLQTVFDDITKNITEGITKGDITYNVKGRPKPFNSGKVPDAYKVKKIWEALAKDPPVKAHCVARAVQLLSVAAIKGVGDGFSSVCRMNFPYIKDGSVPTPGQSITTEHGIYALAMLFVDGIVGKDSTPKITDTPKFQDFKVKLKTFFERNPVDPAAPISLTDITDKTLASCRGHDKEKVQLTGGIVYTLRSKARELLNRQTTHIGRVMTIMFKLFDERQVRAGSFAINPVVLAAGMKGINDIAEESRDMLIEYYGDCEKTYTEGLNIIRGQTGDPKFIPE